MVSSQDGNSNVETVRNHARRKEKEKERGDFLVSLVKNWEREERGIIAAWAEKMNLT